MSDKYQTDDYDPAYELARLQLDEPTKRLVLLDSSDETTPTRGYVGVKVPLAVSSVKKVVKNKMTTKGNVAKSLSPPTIIDLFCHFVTATGRKVKHVRGMINFQHRKISKIDELPYPNVKVVPSSRLELESEMRRVSPVHYGEFLAEVMALRMRWLVHNHACNNRSFSESNITSLMYEGYVGKYICVVDGRSSSVWHFDDTIWAEISPAEVWQELSTTFIEYLRSFIHQGGDEWDDACTDIVNYLSAVVSRERIQRDLLQRLTGNSFQSKLNSHSHLVGMSNGVYDFGKNRLRDALPMDYISMSTRINYVEEEDEDLRAELDEILDTIFPDKKVRKFFIQSCASLLEGRNREKYVYIWWGKGNNAKSMMEGLLAATLGDYSTVAATSLVTGKRGNADSASPQLSALEGKLAVFLQEPNPNETIKIGMIKELSGNDAITARALFKGNRTFIPKFKLIIVCNTAIEIPNIDAAFTNRLIVIPFESTFRTKDDYRRRKKKGMLTKYDHLLDATVSRKITKYAEVFFRMLVKEFENIGDEPLHVPRKVRKATRRYVEENNFSLRFISEQCVEIDSDDGTNIKTLHSELRNWMMQHHGGKKVPNIDVFREELINRSYEIDVKGTVHGLAMDYD